MIATERMAGALSAGGAAGLGPGRFHGRTVAQRRLAGLRLSEICYPPGLRIPRHDHELASLCFVIAGDYDERYGLGRRTCRPGMVVLHPEGEAHADDHGAAPVRLLSVEIEAARLGALREDAPVLREADDFAVPAMSHLAADLCREFREDHTAASLAIEALFLELLVESCRRGRTADDRGGAAGPVWLERAEAFLRAHFARPIVLGEVAAACGVHPSHLARTFRRRRGCSVGGYLRRLRLEAARRALERRSPPPGLGPGLAEVAADCGFADQSHLTRLFRAAYGLTPAAYRRQSRA